MAKPFVCVCGDIVLFKIEMGELALAYQVVRLTLRESLKVSDVSTERNFALRGFEGCVWEDEMYVCLFDMFSLSINCHIVRPLF